MFLSSSHRLTSQRRDGLGGINEQHPEICALEVDKQSYLRLSNRSAVDVSLDLLREFPERQITYIALGPLTNLAHLVREDKDLVTSHIGRIICMGGALDVPGNTTPVAECESYNMIPSLC